MPAPGDALSLEGADMFVGGCAGNFAIDVAKLGLPVMLSARIGNDGFGKMVYRVFQEHENRINVEGIIFDQQAGTTCSVVCVNDEGERAILTNLGSTLNFCKNDIPESFLQECDIFFVAGGLLLNSFEGPDEVELLRWLQSKGKITVMDTCYDTEEIWLPKIRGAIRYLDVFMPSYNEAKRMTDLTDVDEIADFFLNLGAGNVILKMGEKGSYICRKNMPRYYIPAILNEHVADTTGAGDSYCAGFISGMALGLDFDTCAMMGNAVGYYCVGSVGPQKGIPALADIMKLVELQKRNGRKHV